MKMKLVKWAGIPLLAAATVWAQAPATSVTTHTTRTTVKKKPVVRPAVTAEDVRALRDALAAQQQQMAEQQRQIEQLRTELQQRNQADQSQLQQAQAQVAAQQVTVEQQKETIGKLSTDVTDLKGNLTSTATQIQENQKRVGELEHPAAIRFKGITITPGGFIEAGGVYRTHNENASINSASGDFNIPLAGTTNARMSEFRFDARQSRLSLLAEGKIGSVKATGYYEMDFLGAAPTANENQSNSFNIRQRQLWASAEFPHGITFTGGQQWSLLTLNRKGMANRTEFLPMTINAQYVIGYDWARQPSFRVVKNFNDEVWAGFAVENPSTVVNVQGITIGGTATLPPVFGFNTSPNAQSPNGNFTLSNTPGANGVSTNVAPDLVAKLTFEPGWGHFEIKGVGRFFRDRFSGHNNNSFGGGIGAGMILPIVKSKVDFIAEGLAGNGLGRYGSGGGVDVTLRPDASIALIRSYHALAGPEIHIGKKLDIYAYVGEEYYARHFSTSGSTSAGYGSFLLNNAGCTMEQTTSTAPSCPNQTRYAIEGTPGFWYRFYKGSAGTVQWGMQYSYSQRALWRAAAGGPKGIENQVYTSFRYYLP
jgi:hypothetical protein